MITAARPIRTLDELRDHLQYAVGIELTTIPAYLAALYTIDEGANTAAYEVIQSVVLEEMLHMALAANVLNAIGGVPTTAPVAGGRSPVPVFPTKVPFIARIPEIHLQRFSPAAVAQFVAIEYPDEPLEPSGTEEQYNSIGAFYAAIEAALREFATQAVFQAAREARRGCQVGPEHYYGGAGTVIAVHDLDTAVAALAQIVRQGEGAPEEVRAQTPREHVADGAATPGRLPAPYSVDLDRLPFDWKMYSHYARFSEIAAGRYYRPDQRVGDPPAGDVLPTDWNAVRPMVTDPKAADYAGTGAYEPMVACNRVYTELVDLVYASFDGAPERLGEAVPAMYRLKYCALALVNMPSPLDPALTLGPAFEYLGAPPAPRPRAVAEAAARS